MSNRSWYYAAQGAQQGPIAEAELRDLVARGAVTAETLVWSDGMSGWDKAGRIPGLISPGLEGGSRPTGLAPPPQTDMTGQIGAAPLSAKLELWPYLGWALLIVVGEIVVVLSPLTAVYLYRYVVDRIRLPGRPNLSFTGQPLDIWYVYNKLAVLSYVGLSDNAFVKLLAFVGQAFLGWMILRWGI